MSLQNQTGTFVRPDPEAFQAGLATIDWDATQGFYADTTNLAGAGAYPMAVVTYVVLPRNRGQGRIKRVLDLFRLAFRQGAQQAAGLGYIPVSPQLARQIEAYWRNASAR